MLKYIVVITIALIVAQGVYVGWYAVKTVENVKAQQQYQRDVYEWEDNIAPVRRWQV